MPTRHLLAACAAVALAVPAATPAIAARPVHRRLPAPLPERQTVTVHRGVDGAAPRFAAERLADGRFADERFADGGFAGAGFGGYAPIGYWEANYGREDDAAIFAQRYGCAREIWNAKSNRYMSPCN